MIFDNIDSYIGPFCMEVLRHPTVLKLGASNSCEFVILIWILEVGLAIFKTALGLIKYKTYYNIINI